jgi:hypothetical protein
MLSLRRRVVYGGRRGVARRLGRIDFLLRVSRACRCGSIHTLRKVRPAETDETSDAYPFPRNGGLHFSQYTS